MTKQTLIKSDVPPGWFGDFATPQYFLPRGADVHLSAVLGGDSTTSPSRGRYWWELECSTPVFRTSTDPQFIDLPAGPTQDPSSPPLPMATVSGTLNLGACDSGIMWFHYDEGDPSVGEALFFQFDAFNPSTTGNVELWAWVTPTQADQVQLTGKLPIPTSVRMGMYFLKAQEYAMMVQGLFTGYKLIRGTITFSDALFEFAENFNQIEGYFLPTNLISGVNFQVAN